MAGDENVQGEARKKLDMIANDVLLAANEWGGHLAAMASEEMADPYPIPNRYPLGEFLLLFDRLDGSSNIDVNVSIGIIFSLLRLPDGVETPSEAEFLQPGRKQVAAGYAEYGPSSMMVLSIGVGVAVIALDRETASWTLVEDGISRSRARWCRIWARPGWPRSTQMARAMARRHARCDRCRLRR